MNRPIQRLFIFVAVLFAVLVAYTSRWTVFEASSLRNNKLNVRGLIGEERTPRGAILAANGSVLARSSVTPEGVYIRHYPFGAQFGHVVGYDYPAQGRAGLEKYRNSVLTGGNHGPGVERLLRELQGQSSAGDKVYTTLRPSAQRTALTALAGHSGAVVAVDPGTGAVEVMASTPGFDPNKMATQSGAQELNHMPGSALVNRAVADGYAPGSTFKLVTATAALDTGGFTPQSTLSGRNGLVVSGVPLNNDNNDNFGELTLTQALAQSVNTVWAQVAERVGKPTLAHYMALFGFDHSPQLDYPTEEMTPSGEYRSGSVIAPTSPEVDVGRMGIGQDKLNVTPLQMAEVAATIANRGTLMVPHLTQRIVTPEGQVTRIQPKVQAAVMKPSTAAAITTMMEAVVREGTGTAAQLPGVTVAGKTGTAETQIGNRLNNVWFVCFAPAAQPRVAMAVTVQGVPGVGGAYAAPIAREVLATLLHE